MINQNKELINRIQYPKARRALAVSLSNLIEAVKTPLSVDNYLHARIVARAAEDYLRAFETYKITRGKVE